MYAVGTSRAQACINRTPLEHYFSYAYSGNCENTLFVLKGHEPEWREHEDDRFSFRTQRAVQFCNSLISVKFGQDNEVFQYIDPSNKERMRKV